MFQRHHQRKFWLRYMYVIVSEYENMMGYGLWTMLGTLLTLLENILTDNEQNLYQILKKTFIDNNLEFKELMRIVCLLNFSLRCRSQEAIKRS